MTQQYKFKKKLERQIMNGLWTAGKIPRECVVRTQSTATKRIDDDYPQPLISQLGKNFEIFLEASPTMVFCYFLFLTRSKLK